MSPQLNNWSLMLTGADGSCQLQFSISNAIWIPRRDSFHRNFSLPLSYLWMVKRIALNVIIIMEFHWLAHSHSERTFHSPFELSFIRWSDKRTQKEKFTQRAESSRLTSSLNLSALVSLSFLCVLRVPSHQVDFNIFAINNNSSHLSSAILSSAMLLA